MSGGAVLATLVGGVLDQVRQAIAVLVDADFEDP
jgi:hypothetical protein